MRKLYTRDIIKRYIQIPFVFALSFFVIANTLGQSINSPMIHQKINYQSTFMIVVNPVVNKQLNLEKTVSQKEERKALKKYLKKAKKDLHQNHERLDEKRMVSKGGNAVLKVLFILLGICLGILLIYILILPVKLFFIAILGL